MHTIKKFADGQVASEIQQSGDLIVQIRGNSYEDLFTAASIKEAWDHADWQHKQCKSRLEIYCLMAQRSDRRFRSKQSFDLAIVARFINSMEFDEVAILHPHSDVSLALIKNSTVIDYFPHVQSTYKALNQPILISPDAGAYKATHAIAERLGADLIPSNKVRIAGEPNIVVQGDVKGKTCLIIDDIADGGRTFLLLAEELRKQGAQKVYLYVTHGMFHFGVQELLKSLDGIYCTNSYRTISEKGVVQYGVI
jgi:ribose-phosphate pyrophosphokinase